MFSKFYYNNYGSRFWLKDSNYTMLLSPELKRCLNPGFSAIFLCSHDILMSFLQNKIWKIYFLSCYLYHKVFPNWQLPNLVRPRAVIGVRSLKSQGGSHNFMIEAKLFLYHAMYPHSHGCHLDLLITSVDIPNADSLA